MKVALAAAVAALAVFAAGCGGSTHHNATPRINPNCLNHPVGAAQKRKYRHIKGILALMQRAKTHDKESRLTDRFLLAEETSGLSAYVRNRLIDFAVAYATPICQDCFQGLEANRPIARPCSGT